jgi:hypothetical protein
LLFEFRRRSRSAVQNRGFDTRLPTLDADDRTVDVAGLDRRRALAAAAAATPPTNPNVPNPPAYAPVLDVPCARGSGGA